MPMILTAIESLLDDYTKWVRDKTILKVIGEDYVEITTPYLDRNNDCVQIYVKKDQTGYRLSDDGYIISDLKNSGCSLDSPKRVKLLETTLAGFGVQREGDELKSHATNENFPLKKHNFVQAILAVNDLFYLAQPYVESLFHEDVASWLDYLDVRYTPNIKFAGKSGFDHMFDFVIPKSKKQPERILQAINNPKKDMAESLLWKWFDTRDTRRDDTLLIAIMNDSNAPVSPTVVDAFQSYGLSSYLWSERNSAKELLLN